MALYWGFVFVNEVYLFVEKFVVLFFIIFFEFYFCIYVEIINYMVSMYIFIGKTDGVYWLVIVIIIFGLVVTKF